MKYLVLCALSLSAFATMFSTNKSFENPRFSEEYELPNTVEVTGIVLRGDIVIAKFNGTSLKARAKKKVVLDGNADFNSTVYTAVIKKDVIIPARSCMEEDTVSYELDFMVNARNQEIVAEALNLRAKRYFSFDICHDFSPITEYVYYKKVR